MKDWKGIAKSRGLELSVRELERLTQSLDALEEAFRPLVRDLTPDLEPSITFRLEGASE